TSRSVQELSIDDVARDVALEITQGQLGTVSLDIQGTEPPPVIMAVAPEIRAVIHAIMVNAVEASPEKGQVTVALDTLANGHVLIRVDDEGPGLPSEIKEKLFTPNQTTKEHGTGMGLFLAHRIVTNRYQGRLSVLDRPNGGTRVEIECSSRTDDSHG
ncbi:MAG: ATP-binding protein, partial [Planctomycetota bacterium]|nr:ATP-binding protein [Planctomycetota bacterium]